LLKVHRDAKLPSYASPPWRKRALPSAPQAEKTELTSGKVAIFASCYINFNQPDIGEDFAAVFTHNQIQLKQVPSEVCCGMPKMELGDLEAVARAKEKNIPILADMVDQGFDLMSLVPSCVLMFKQELPLMFPDDELVKKVQQAFFDPFEYLALRHKENKLNTEFKNSLGQVDYQVACHLRVQRIGLKTRDILNMIPDTKVNVLERCSGHDGTYGVRAETYTHAVKIAKPIVNKIKSADSNYISSDCPMACSHISHLSEQMGKSKHPISLLKIAYGL
jgi:Fe-S oxidoreductase